MEFTAASGLMRTGEILCDSGAELVLDGEYTVPDYQPEIFRIVRTEVKPVLVQRAAAAERASAEGYAEITVFYQAADGKRLSAASFKLPFSRQFELRGAASPNCDIDCRVRVEYLNCHAVSSRRLQARGTLSVKMKVLSHTESQIASSITGGGAQTSVRRLAVFPKQAQEERQFTISEMLEMDFGACTMPTVLRTEAYVQPQSSALADGRLEVRGAALVSVAVEASEESGELRVLHGGYEIPFSQSLNAEGFPEGCVLAVSADCVAASARPRTDGKPLLELLLNCVLRIGGFVSEEVGVIEDAFSTEYEVQLDRSELCYPSAFTKLSGEIVLRAEGEAAQDARLLDWGLTGLSLRPSGETGADAAVEGSFFCVLQTADGTVSGIELPARADYPAAAGGDGICELSLAFRQTEAQLRGGKLTLSAAGSVSGSLLRTAHISAVSGMRAKEDDRKAAPACALSVYYTKPEETVWQIAKRFGASPEAIIAENGRLENDGSDSGMLLIPLV